MTSSVALANPRRFTAQPAQVIKLCSTHSTPLDQINMVNNGCVQWKDSLNPDAKTGLADCDCFPRAAVFAGDDYTFKRLQAFLRLGFLNTNVYANSIPRLKIRNILAQLGFFNII